MDRRDIRTILAVNFNHDGAGALLVDGELRGYVNTERFSRLKKHPGLREEDLDGLLSQAGVELEQIDHVLLCNLGTMDTFDIPRLHGSDLKHTWLGFSFNGTRDTVRIRGRELPCTVNPDHHALHAALAFFTSPFESAAVLVADPLRVQAYLGQGTRLRALDHAVTARVNAPMGYCLVATELFGSAIVGAGKVMGLAPFGRCDGSLAEAVERITTYPELRRLAESDPAPVECQGRELNARLAYLIQLGLERQLAAALERLAGICAREGVEPNVCLSGGTALNAVANQFAFERSGFARMHLHPACGDDGTAIGAALWMWHEWLGHPRREWSNRELMYSRREYDEADVRRAVAAAGDAVVVEERRDHPERAAELVAAGRIVGWFDGASEIGPRALGHRSMLADPRDPDMADRLNRQVKLREPFRPFAPSVLNEHAGRWFGLADTPFMLRASPVLRDGVPAVTHVDGTSRIQTVRRTDDPSYHRMLTAFHERTGVPLVLNTSLNIKGEPVVETPRDAVDALLGSEMDGLVFPGLVVHRR